MSIRALRVNTGLTGKKHTFLPGVPTGQRLGWCQFYYGHYAGSLQPINFAQSILIPEFQGATGGKLYMNEGVSWTVVPVNDPPNGFSLENPSGLLNYALNALSGASYTLPGFGEFDQNQRNGKFQIPRVNSTGKLDSAPIEENELTHSHDTNSGDYAFYATAVAWASDIAQMCAMYNAAETFEDTGSFTLFKLCTPSAGVPRNAKIIISLAPPIPSNNFGATGAPMLGHYCWVYDGYMGPLHYINNLNVWAVPELPFATDLYVVLKPGVVGSVTLGVNEFVTLATITVTGQINFLANQLSGLLSP